MSSTVSLNCDVQCEVVEMVSFAYNAIAHIRPIDAVAATVAAAATTTATAASATTITAAATVAATGAATTIALHFTTFLASSRG